MTAEQSTPEENPEDAVAKKAGRPKGSTGTKLSPAKRAELFMLWRSGEYTLRQLAERFDKTEENLSRLFKKYDVKKGELSEELVAKTEAVTKAKLSEEVAAQIEAIKLAKTEANKFYETVRKLTIVTIVENRKLGRPLSAIAAEVKVLEGLARTAKILQTGQYNALGIDKDDKSKDEEITELRIVPLTTAQIRAAQTDAAAVADELDRLADELGDEDLLQGDSDDDEDDDDV